MPRPHHAVDSPGNAQLEAAECALCGANDPAPGGYTFPPYRVVRCNRCDLWYTSPRLAEEAMLAAYAEDSYFEGAEGPGYSSYRAQEATLRTTFRKLLRDLAGRGIEGDRLLEVGCAYGFFLDEARSHFSYRAGTDYSAGAAAKARDFADTVYLGGLDEIPKAERFDLIACIHVIEHIYHPRPFVEQLFERLNPGGWIFLACPDMGGFWRPLMGKRWPFFKLPEHVTYFTRPTLTRLLETAGCDRVEALPYASYFSLDLIAEKLGRRAPGGVADRQLRLPGTTVACAGRKPA